MREGGSLSYQKTRFGEEVKEECMRPCNCRSIDEFLAKPVG
jgi:hypothetical protein